MLTVGNSSLGTHFYFSVDHSSKLSGFWNAVECCCCADMVQTSAWKEEELNCFGRVPWNSWQSASCFSTSEFTGVYRRGLPLQLPLSPYDPFPSALQLYWLFCSAYSPFIILFSSRGHWNILFLLLGMLFLPFFISSTPSLRVPLLLPQEVIPGLCLD